MRLVSLADCRGQQWSGPGRYPPGESPTLGFMTSMRLWSNGAWIEAKGRVPVIAGAGLEFDQGSG